MQKAVKDVESRRARVKDLKLRVAAEGGLPRTLDGAIDYTKVSLATAQAATLPVLAVACPVGSGGPTGIDSVQPSASGFACRSTALSTERLRPDTCAPCVGFLWQAGLSERQRAAGGRGLCLCHDIHLHLWTHLPRREQQHDPVTSCSLSQPWSAVPLTPHTLQPLGRVLDD